MKREGGRWAETGGTSAPRTRVQRRLSGPWGRSGVWRWKQTGLRDHSVGGGDRIGGGNSGPGLGAAGETEEARS